MKVPMVCLGNICRSPMAEGIIRKLAKIKSQSIPQVRQDITSAQNPKVE